MQGLRAGPAFLHAYILLFAALACMPAAGRANPLFTEQALFVSGQNGYHTFRIPAITKTAAGTLLAFCEGRKGAVSDAGDIDLVLRRSTDGGTTWGPLTVVWDDGANTCGNPSPVVDHQTGTIWLLSTWNLGTDNETMIVNGNSTDTRRVFIMKSEDDGLSWSSAEDITSTTKHIGWTWYATGPGAGIQLQRGAQAGRLLVACDYLTTSKSWGSHVIYSDDHGLNWQIGAVAPQTATVKPNENLAVELVAPSPDGGSQVYFSARDHQGPRYRAETFSLDGGTTYSPAEFIDAPHFVTPMVQAGLARFTGTDQGDSGNRLLFSCPNTPGSASYSTADRTRISIWSSFDEAETWSEVPRLIYEGPSAYSDMVRIDTTLMGLLYEKGLVSPYETITFARFNEAWLDVPAEYPRAAFWTLNEREAGQTAPMDGESILDLHPDGNNLHLSASFPFPVVAGSPAYGNGSALSFNGNGGLYINDRESANAFDYGPHDSFTIEIVCRIPNGAARSGALVTKDVGSSLPSWWLRLESGKARFLLSDTGAEPNLFSSVNINDGEWHHIAAVRDASNPDDKRLRLYIDGQPAGDTADTTTQSLANSNKLQVGRFNNSTNLFTGDIDLIRITPRPLIPSQFVGLHTQQDADADGIPDTYERAETGSLSVLGTGDADSDGYSDAVEFALGSDPLDPASVPVMTLDPGIDRVDIHFTHRELPPWFDIVQEFATDLLTEWMPADGTTTQTLTEDGLIQVIQSFPYPEGLPDQVFFRLQVTAQP